VRVCKQMSFIAVLLGRAMERSCGVHLINNIVKGHSMYSLPATKRFDTLLSLQLLFLFNLTM